jgi:hypothetical protein
MDRINIKCLISGKDLELQLDKKLMPGEIGPCFMITATGTFKGYIVRQKNGVYNSLGPLYFTINELQLISEELKRII